MRAVLPVLAALLVVAGCRRGADEEFAVVPVRPAPALEATRASGEVFQLSGLRGKVVLLSFGYRSCPDVCPTTLSQLQSLQKRLKSQAQEVEVVFVTVDPERDSRRIRGLRSQLQPSLYGAAPAGRGADAGAEGLRCHSGAALPRSSALQQPPLHRRPALLGRSHGGYLIIDRHGALRLRIPYDAALDRLQASVERLLAEET